MPQLWGVLPAAGHGTRFNADLPKQYWNLSPEQTVLEHSAACLLHYQDLALLVVALDATDQHWHNTALAKNNRVTTVQGGASRCQSVINALSFLDDRANDDDWVLVHDASRPCVPQQCVDAMIKKLYADAESIGGLLVTAVTDQLHYLDIDGRCTTTERDDLWHAQTPQMFRFGLLRRALISHSTQSRDEAGAVIAAGHKPEFITGSRDNIKITYAEDLSMARMILGQPRQDFRIGNGFDSHAYGVGDHIMISGVRINSDVGIVAHSDGDVVLHALCDAILGACGLGDIGDHFPDNDMRWRDSASEVFVRHCLSLALKAGFRPHNIDLTLIAQYPIIKPYVPEMLQFLYTVLGMQPPMVNIKATTTEGLGFIGRKEGIAATATVLMHPASV